MRAVSTQNVFRIAALLTFVTIALGSMVAATDSSSACPAWPICYANQVGPQWQTALLENPATEFVHRLISSLCLLSLLWAGLRGRRHPDARVRVLPWVALVLAVGSAVFGMMIILFHLPLGLALVDVGGAVVALGLITLAGRALTDAGRPATLSTHVTGRLAGAAFVVLLVMHLLGLLVAGTTEAGTGSFTRVIGWPMWQVVAIDHHPALQVVRMGMAATAVVLIALTVAAARRVNHLRHLAALLGLLAVAEVAMSVVITTGGLSAGQTNGIGAGIAVAYAMCASGILWTLAHLSADALPPLTSEPASAARTHAVAG